MSRIRSIKPGYFRSASLARCSLPARVTFAGLWTEADDLGNGEADAKVLAGVLWPHDDNVTGAVVEAHLVELMATGHIAMYVVGDKRYFSICNWVKHQAAAFRRGEGQHPGPDDGSPWSGHESCKPHDSARVGVLEVGGGGGGGGDVDARPKAARRLTLPLEDASIEKTTSGGSGSSDELGQGRPGASDFHQWWSAYPRKTAKQDALEAFKKAIKAGAALDQILDATRAWASLWAQEGRPADKIPYPGTWLRRGDWKDLPEATPLVSRRASRQEAIARGVARASR